MQEEQETKKRYIITDPYFIIETYDYSHKVADRSNQWQIRNIDPFRKPQLNNPEESILPFNTKYMKGNTPITIYAISRVMNGYGTQQYKEDEIRSDSGYVCIAENRNGWDEDSGTLFGTLTEAKIAFPHIVKNG